MCCWDGNDTFYKVEYFWVWVCFVVQHLNSCCTTEITQIGYKTLKLSEIQRKIVKFCNCCIHWAVVIQRKL